MTFFSTILLYHKSHEETRHRPDIVKEPPTPFDSDRSLSLLFRVERILYPVNQRLCRLEQIDAQQAACDPADQALYYYF